jgi:hypothetical protein
VITSAFPDELVVLVVEPPQLLRARRAHKALVGSGLIVIKYSTGTRRIQTQDPHPTTPGGLIRLRRLGQRVRSSTCRRNIGALPPDPHLKQ